MCSTARGLFILFVEQPAILEEVKLNGDKPTKRLLLHKTMKCMNNWPLIYMKPIAKYNFNYLSHACPEAVTVNDGISGTFVLMLKTALVFLC